jgi:flagellar biosynthetic protein FlhB
MLCGALALGTIVEAWAAQWRGVYQAFLALGVSRAWQSEGVEAQSLAIRQASLNMLFPIALLGGAVVAGALLAGLAQSGGLRWTAETLLWKWQRISPAANLKNLFSTRGLARLVKSLVPDAILLYFAIRKIFVQAALPPLSTLQLPSMFGAIYDLLLDTAWILFAWSVIDYLLEWRSWELRQRMSKQEVREEHKQTEGSPQIRARIRNLRRQMRRRQLKVDIRRASVVITNPSHYAVALAFSFETMEAPRMVAKGRDILAARIREEALWAGVPIVENPPLARTLYRQLEPGQVITYDLYAAVAAILAYLYRQQVEERIARARASGSGRPPSSPVDRTPPQAESPRASREHR